MNVQQSIITGIREQLFHHNYLVLPSFGGFVLQHRSSHFSSAGNVLAPPAKTLSFNVQLRQNDGILSSWLQKKLGCNADDALQHLKDFSEYCSTILNARRRLTLQGIGFFYLDFEENICFEPQQDANFMRESFGLGAVVLKEINAPVKEATPRAIYADRLATVPSAATTTHRYNYRRIVSPLLFTIIFASLLLLFVANRNLSGPLYASVFGAGKSTAYVPVIYPPLQLAAVENSPVKPYVADAKGIATINVDGSVLPVLINVGTARENPQLKNVAPAAHHGFQVVLGCFAIEQNAERLIKQLAAKDLSAFISGKNTRGMYIVIAGNFQSHSSALSQLNAVKQVVPSAWIKRPNQ